jgi:methyl-accepting chemotaxis protein
MNWFVNFSTRLKLILSFGLLVFFLLVVIVTACNGLITVRKSQDELFQHDFLSSLSLVELEADLNRARAQMLEMMVIQDRTKQQILERDMAEKSKEIDEGLKSVSESLKGRPQELKKFEEMNLLLADYRKSREEVLSFIYNGKINDAQSLSTTVQNERYNRIRAITIELGASALSLAKTRIAQTETKTRVLSWAFGIIGLLVFFLSVGTVAFLNRIIAKPLKEITTAAGKIAAGDPEVTTPSSQRMDEVGQLTHAFDAMVKYLQNMTVVSAQVARGDLTATVTPLSDRDILGNAFLDMTGYLRQMATVSGQVAGGDLTVTVTPVSEKDLLGNAFANMVENLRKINQEVRNGVNVLASSASQILASTTQMASGMSETATSVSETTATVEEVKQTAQLSAEKSRKVSENAQKAAMIAEQGNAAVTETVSGINNIKGLMETVAESVVMLSEQTQSIGEIITVVNDLAQQSNLLAVNAAIEASKAGEQGKGFAVVAQEIKSLADQSKQATEQVRTILADIQKATGKSVLAAEQVSKAVAAGVKQAAESGESIMMLAESIGESAQAAAQIAASSQQQQVGMEQVAMAMENIKRAAQQSVSGTRQVEQAAQALNELGLKLKEMVGRFTV